MKQPPTFICLALLAIAGTASAAAPKTKAAARPELADTWIAQPKVYEGKKITTSVQEVGDVGGVSSAAAYGVVPITTGTAQGESGAEIPVLVPVAKLPAFIESMAPKEEQGKGSFGRRIRLSTLTATFVTIQGEPALIFGEATAAAKAVKPSLLLKQQRESAKSGAKQTEESSPTQGRRPPRNIR